MEEDVPRRKFVVLCKGSFDFRRRIDKEKLLHVGEIRDLVPLCGGDDESAVAIAHPREKEIGLIAEHHSINSGCARQ